jgi:3-isopropylmalate/(R)-2-methylmalate dehydratase small subunit
MNKTIKGKAYVLGNNIDTDQIIPAEHLVYSLTDENESKKYGEFALSGVPPSQSGLPEGNIKFTRDGNHKSDFKIIIGGSNFGCGSSREHAPFALQVAGVQAIVAESYARIFYRNSVDGGFLVPLESNNELKREIKTGDEVEVDLTDNTIKNLTNGKDHQLRPVGSVYEIVKCGGLFNYARENKMI